MTTPFPANFILSLISLPFWGASFLMANTVLFALFLGIRLRLDRQQIALTWKMLGFKYVQLVLKNWWMKNLYIGLK
ncbi:MAG: hypothetical protein RMY28_027460 [Nostoc sp. ChiSLP01]|nr:hypothetical protein [Nostoc sp. CmiSLP01]